MATLNGLNIHKACDDGAKFYNSCDGLEDFWLKCERGDWMIWLFATLYPDKVKELSLAKGYCANLIRNEMVEEDSVKAVDAAISFGEGKITIEKLITACNKACYFFKGYAAKAAFSASNAKAFDIASEAAFTLYLVNKASNDINKSRKETAVICRKYLNITI